MKRCECGRALEKRQRKYCSECAVIRRQITFDVASHKYLSKPENRSAHNARCREYYHRNYFSYSLKDLRMQRENA